MLTAVILAGGLGTRLRSVVSDVPKPMAPINGKPFLEFLLDYWASQGVTNFILSVGYLNQTIINHFGNSYKGLEIRYSIEDEPLGTGGGLIKALALYDKPGPVLVVNGDTFFSVDASTLLYKYEEYKHPSVIFSLFKTNDISRYMGLNFEEESGIVQRETALRNSDYVYANGGVYLINTDYFRMFDFNTVLSLENDVFKQMAEMDHLFYGVSFVNEKFIDIGIPSDYLKARKVIF